MHWGGGRGGEGGESVSVFEREVKRRTSRTVRNIPLPASHTPGCLALLTDFTIAPPKKQTWISSTNVSWLLDTRKDAMTKISSYLSVFSCVAKDYRKALLLLLLLLLLLVLSNDDVGVARSTVCQEIRGRELVSKPAISSEKS